MTEYIHLFGVNKQVSEPHPQLRRKLHRTPTRLYYNVMQNINTAEVKGYVYMNMYMHKPTFTCTYMYMYIVHSPPKFCSEDSNMTILQKARLLQTQKEGCHPYTVYMYMYIHNVFLGSLPNDSRPRQGGNGTTVFITCQLIALQVQ